MIDMLVTTMDIKRRYEVIGPISYQISSSGIQSDELNKKVREYNDEIIAMQEDETLEPGLKKIVEYGEWALSQSNYEKFFFISSEELKKRAQMLGGNAIIGMRHHFFCLDRNGFNDFHFQIHGMVVRLKD